MKKKKKYLRWCLMASRSFLNFCRDSRSFTARHSLKIRLVKRISLKSKAAWSFLFEVIWVWNNKIINFQRCKFCLILESIFALVPASNLLCKCNVNKIYEDSLDLIPSPSSSVKIQTLKILGMYLKITSLYQI